jgi:hypothetical protein
MSSFDVSAISGHKKSIEEGVGTGGGYVAYTPQYDNSPLDFNATGNGDPKGYKEASIWT